MKLATAIDRLNPFWFAFRTLRPGVSYWLPGLGTTASLGDRCMQVAWLKWSLMIGLRLP